MANGQENAKILSAMFAADNRTWSEKKADIDQQTQQQRLQNRAMQAQNPNFIGPSKATIPNLLTPEGKAQADLQLEQALERYRDTSFTATEYFQNAIQKEQEKADMADKALRAISYIPSKVWSGFSTAVNNAGWGTLYGVSDFINSYTHDPVTRKLADTADWFLQNQKTANQQMDAYTDKYVPQAVNTYVGEALRGVGQSAPMLAEAYFTGGASLGSDLGKTAARVIPASLKLAGISAGGAKYHDLRKQGISPQQAMPNAVTSGLSEMAIEQMGYDELLPFFRNPIVGSNVKNAARQVIRSGAAEGLEEVTSDVTGNLIDKATYDPGKKWFGSGGVVDPVSMAASGATGALSGLMLGGIGAVGSNLSGGVDTRLEAYCDTPLQQTAVGTDVHTPETASAFSERNRQGSVRLERGVSEAHAPEIQRVMQEYEQAVDADLAEFAQYAVSHPNDNKTAFQLEDVSPRAAEDIQRLTGIDVEGFGTEAKANTFRHIEQRHGQNGKADQSMADVNDVARMQYVIDNYDEMELLDATSKEFLSREKHQAPQIMLSKRVDGTYYVVEAVPDTNKRKLEIVSAYKKAAQPMPDDVNAHTPEANVQNDYSATANAANQTADVQAPAPNVRNDSDMAASDYYIPQSEENVKDSTGDMRSQSPNTVNPVPIYETDTEPVKAAKQVMNLLSDRYGVQYEMKQMDADINGYYDGDTQKIYINENAKDPLLNVVAHEFLHAFKDIDAEGYRMLRNITESDFHLARFQEYKQKTLEAWDKAGLTNYKNKSDAEINDMVIEEAMSDLMGEIMRDPTTIERIATADRNLAQRIIDYLGQIIERIKQYFKGENKEIRDLVEHYEQVKEIYQEVVSQSDGQMRQTTGNTDRQYSFAGQKAQQADMSALQRAQQMKADGASAEDILRETGWFVGLDGQWRFELDDSQMKIDYDGMQQKREAWLSDGAMRLLEQEPNLTEEQARRRILRDEQMPLTLGDLLDYPELYRQYPDMADMPVYLYDGAEDYAGSYHPDSDAIVLTRSGMEGWKRTLPHEIQHAIQVREGFDMGFPSEGSPTDAQYWNSAGEIEAREAGRRQGMTADERRESLPMRNVRGAVLSDGSEAGPRYSIKTGRDGKPTVVIEEDIFAGHEGEKPHKVIRDYIKNHYTGDFARIIESGQKVYFGKDLPGEYTQSVSANRLYPDFRYAKNQASQNLNELVEIGTDRRWSKNVKSKHNLDAKYGWYKYATRFQVNGKTYDADVLIRNDADGKKYLYDVVNIKQNRELSKLPSNQNGSGTERSNSLSTDSIPQDGETVNTSIRDDGNDDTRYSVFRKNSRGQKATEAMQLYEQSGNAAHLPELTWAKQYQRDSEKRGKYLENQISTAEFEAENAKTPEQQERLRKLIDNLREQQAKTMLDIETSGALMDAIDSEVVERNYDLAAIIDDLKDVDKGLKIKSGNYRFNDVYRNFERVFGEHFDVVRPLLESFDSAKGDYAHEAVGTAQELYSFVVKGLGIKPGSRESKAIQWIAEGERTPNLKNTGDVAALKEMGEDIENLKPDVKVPYTKEQLYREFGKEKADKIVKAEGWFREQYDRLINEINRTRRRIYPNNPDKQIPKRKDYMRHFRELRDGVRGLVDILQQDNNITPNLAGISEFTQPKKKWASIEQQRKGNVTDEGAIEGFLDYLPQAEYAVYIDPYIDRFRSLGRDLAQLKTDAGKSNLNSFIAYLGDFANDLAGKTSGIDRVVLKSMGSSGRTMLRALGWLNNRTKANAVVANAGSIAKQVMNLPNGMMYMQNPVNIMRGIVDVVKGLDKDGKVSQNYKKSGFLTERFMDKAFQKFERMSVGRAAGSLLGMADEFGTRAIWNGLYHEAVQNGESDPAAYADRLTRKAVAGRGIGELPLAYKTQVGKLVLPFQVEVNNTWNVLRDTIQGKTPKGKLPDYGNRVMKTLVWMLATWALGAVLEEAVGSKGGFDPLGDIIDGWQQGYSEQPEAGKLQKAGRAAKRAVQNLAGDFIGSRSFGWMAAELMDAIDSDWSDRFFNGSIFPSQGVNVPALQSLTKTVKKASSGDLVGALAEVGTSFVTPFGGKQLDKTIRGLGDVKRGGGYQNNIYEELSTGERGDRLYELDDNVWNAIRASAFGPSALQENQAYWDEQRANSISGADRRKQEQKATDAFIREYRKNNKNSEVVRLYNETKNKEVFPFEPIDRERKFTEKKKPYQFTLTKEQADTYQKLQNEEMQKAYDKVMQTPEYKNADTEGKKTLLEEARSEAKSKVSAQIKKDYLKEAR